jgi:hypothetical protein
MAEFVSVDKNKYRIVGPITEEDINRINSFKNRTTLILENTVGLSSELVSKIVSDRIVFSIKGGLDYDTKEKYKKESYINRTLVSPSGLTKIIKYFEYNERLIDPKRNENEKAMFLYNDLVVDMEYGQKYENIQSPGTTERSLNGILYGKLVCAGFALVYKEMLDRVGIKCYYQNQKDVHAFNVIEVDGKKYGLDITWDNCDKKEHNGRCVFGRFGHDPEFYTRHGHQLYKDVDDDFNFESNNTERVYDTDEEVFDLSMFTMDQLNEYYRNIESAVNNRKPFRYDLQNQSIEIKNKYLPVDTVDYRLKQEATKEYPINMVLDFLKKRNALQINPQLIEAFSRRRGYILDVGDPEGKYNYGMDLSSIGIDNYKIDRYGEVSFRNGDEYRFSCLHGLHANNSDMSQEELNNLYSQLNQYLNQSLNKYISDVISNIDTLLANYEYKPDEWDTNRAIENGNIYTKLSIIVNSRDYLIQSGMSEQEIDSIIERIMNKYNEIHAPYENKTSQKDHDLDFLSAVFNDVDMIKQNIEYDMHRPITDEELISLCGNVDYMIQLFEKYIIIGGDKKFKFDEYDITKEDLQQLINKLIQDYQKKKINEVVEVEPQNSGMRR